MHTFYIKLVSSYCYQMARKEWRQCFRAATKDFNFSSYFLSYFHRNITSWLSCWLLSLLYLVPLTKQIQMPKYSNSSNKPTVTIMFQRHRRSANRNSKINDSPISVSNWTLLWWQLSLPLRYTLVNRIYHNFFILSRRTKWIEFRI